MKPTLLIDNWIERFQEALKKPENKERIMHWRSMKFMAANNPKKFRVFVQDTYHTRAVEENPKSISFGLEEYGCRRGVQDRDGMHFDYVGGPQDCWSVVQVQRWPVDRSLMKI